MHPFEEAGLGKAPFKCVGVSENWWVSGCGTVRKPGGCCDFCGTGILYEYAIVSSDNKRHVVGCDCVQRTDSVEGFKEVRLAFTRARRGKKAADRMAEREARWAKEKEERAEEFTSSNMALVDALNSYVGDNSFILSMKDALKWYGSLSVNQCDAIKKVLKMEAAKEEHRQKSNYVGVIGEKLEMRAKVESSILIGHTDFYPYVPRFVVNMVTDDGNVLTWFTSKGYDVGDVFTRCKVKSHAEYKGIKATIVNYVK